MKISVVVQVAAGSRERRLYDEKTLEYLGARKVLLPYPYPYGFIVGTTSEDGDGDNVDCYIITGEALRAGSIVECEPVGLLEQMEGDEVDHKVLARLPGQDVALDQALLEELRSFIAGLDAQFPEVAFKIGRILPREAAIQYLRGASP